MATQKVWKNAHLPKLKLTGWHNFVIKWSFTKKSAAHDDYKAKVLTQHNMVEGGGEVD